MFECHHAGKLKSQKGNNPGAACNTTSIHVECTVRVILIFAGQKQAQILE